MTDASQAGPTGTYSVEVHTISNKRPCNGKISSTYSFSVVPVLLGVDVLSEYARSRAWFVKENLNLRRCYISTRSRGDRSAVLYLPAALASHHSPNWLQTRLSLVTENKAVTLYIKGT